jgi:hypothetical protein
MNLRTWMVGLHYSQRYQMLCDLIWVVNAPGHIGIPSSHDLLGYYLSIPGGIPNTVLLHSYLPWRY